MKINNYKDFKDKQYINADEKSTLLFEQLKSFTSIGIKSSDIVSYRDDYTNSLSYKNSSTITNYGRPVLGYDIYEQFVNNIREVSKITGGISLSENIYNVLSAYLTAEEMIELVDKFLTTHSDYLTHKDCKPINLKGD